MIVDGACTVLNVNADETVLHARSKILTKVGYRVFEAACAKEALRLAEALMPELILLDAALPDTPGTEVCRALKANQATAGIKVLLMFVGDMGGNSDTEELRHGADGYATEPVEPAELLAWVNTLLRLRSREAENRRLVEQLSRETAGKRDDDRLWESRERLQYALDSAGMVAWDWSPDSDALIQSSNASSELGLPEGTTLQTGKEYFAMIHEEDQPRVVAAIQRALREGNDYQEEFRLVLADGSVRWVADRGRVAAHDKGKATRMTGVIRDVTELKMREIAVCESEARFRAIFHQAAVGMCLISPEGHLLQINQNLCTLLGEEAEDLLHRKLLDLTHPEDRERNQRSMSSLLLGGAADVSIEQRLLRRDGRSLWVSIYLALLWDAGGRLEHVIGVIQDIDERKRAEEALRESDTERKQAEDALRESESRFRNMADTAPAMLWKADVSGSYTFLSKGWYDFTGQPADSGLGCGWRDAIHPDDQERVRRVFHAAIKQREPFSLDYRLRRAGGPYRWVSDSGRPRFSDHAEFQGYIGSVIDITERKQAEDQLHLLNADLERRVASRTRELLHSQNRLRNLASDLSIAEERERRRVAGELHDYLAQLLVATRMKLNQARQARSVAKHSAVLSEVDQMLDQSLTYTRTLVAQLSPPVLHEFGLPAALKWLGEQMLRHGLTVSSTIETAPIDLTENQAVLLFQSARELLLNVVKHAGTNQASLQLESRPGELRLAVMDQGHGFDTLSVKETTVSRNAFGLFSIRERMESLGGRLEIAAEPGQGTTVMLIMPLAPQAANVESGIVSDELSETGAISRQGASADDQGLSDSKAQHSPFNVQHSELQKNAIIRVLLVDDHAMVRQGLRSLLENHHDVEVVAEAGDGLQAIALVEQHCPDVVVMDLSLPSLDGVEATRRICLTHPATVVIGLSVHQSRHMEEAIRGAGAASYLTKDCAVDQLYEAMSSAMMARSSS